MSRKSEVASRKYKRSRALLVCPACGRDFMVLQKDEKNDSGLRLVSTPHPGPNEFYKMVQDIQDADTIRPQRAGATGCADPGIESYGGRSPESIVFSCWVVLAVLIAWTVLIGIFGVFKLVEWMGQ